MAMPGQLVRGPGLRRMRVFGGRGTRVGHGSLICRTFAADLHRKGPAPTVIEETRCRIEEAYGRL